MNKETKDNTTKKPYKKPQIKRVELKPEEAVLGACKTAITAGPATLPCNAVVTPCTVAGS